MKILVTGGAGYIGGVMTQRLLNDGYEVVVIDDLSRGYEKTIDNRAKFIKGNLLDEQFLKNVFESYTFDGVMHFASYIAVGESMENPGLYFQNNVFSTLKLLEQMKEKKVTRFIFSSTGTVYGNPTTIPIPEDHSKSPENPYSESKLMVEQILSWYDRIFGIRYAALRYFNAAGATLDGTKGENHNPETHLIPNAIHAALTGEAFTLFGEDYDTPDGSCLRDYIHVLDLVEAHVLTFEKLQNEKKSFVYNVGTGKSYSNKEVIAMVKKISGKDFPVKVENRRPGDAVETVADISNITKELGFVPKHSDLETIVKTAWSWHSKKNG